VPAFYNWDSGSLTDRWYYLTLFGQWDGGDSFLVFLSIFLHENATLILALVAFEVFYCHNLNEVSVSPFSLFFPSVPGHYFFSFRLSFLRIPLILFLLQNMGEAVSLSRVPSQSIMSLRLWLFVSLISSSHLHIRPSVLRLTQATTGKDSYLVQLVCVSRYVARM